MQSKFQVQKSQGPGEVVCVFNSQTKESVVGQCSEVEGAGQVVAIQFTEFRSSWGFCLFVCLFVCLFCTGIVLQTGHRKNNQDTGEDRMSRRMI